MERERKERRERETDGHTEPGEISMLSNYHSQVLQSPIRHRPCHRSQIHSAFYRDIASTCLRVPNPFPARAPSDEAHMPQGVAVVGCEAHARRALLRPIPLPLRPASFSSFVSSEYMNFERNERRRLLIRFRNVVFVPSECVRQHLSRQHARPGRVQRTCPPAGRKRHAHAMTVCMAWGG